MREEHVLGSVVKLTILYMHMPYSNNKTCPKDISYIMAYMLHTEDIDFTMALLLL